MCVLCADYLLLETKRGRQGERNEVSKNEVWQGWTMPCVVISRSLLYIHAYRVLFIIKSSHIVRWREIECKWNDRLITLILIFESSVSQGKIMLNCHSLRYLVLYRRLSYDQFRKGWWEEITNLWGKLFETGEEKNINM